MLTVKAHGKINLSIDVLTKLPNGYHQVEMVMQQIALADQVTLETTTQQGITITSNMAGVPLDHSNIAYKGAELLMAATPSYQGGIHIHLEKSLPMEAGLAGGSSNGAAVLVGLNQLLGLNYSQDKLMELGSELGADVPFCILGGTALATGIGTQLIPLVNNTGLDLILVKPSVGVATKEVYENLQLDQLTKKQRPDNKRVMDALAAGNWQELVASWANVLETSTLQLYPEIGRIKEELTGFGIYPLMSGSGTTVFGVLPPDSPLLGQQVKQYFEAQEGYKVFLTTTI